MNAEEKEFDQDLRNLKSTFIKLCYAGLVFGFIGFIYSLTEIGFNFSPEAYLQSKVESRIDKIEDPLLKATANVNQFVIDSLSSYNANRYELEKFQFDSLLIERLLSDPNYRAIDLGPTGFIYITDSIGNVIYSNQTLYRPDQYKSLELVGNNQRDGESLSRFLKSVVLNPDTLTINRQHYKDQSVLKNQQWRVYSKIHPYNITPVIIFNQEEIKIDWQKFINRLFLYILSCLALLMSITYLVVYPLSSRFPKLKKLSLANNVWSFTALSSIYLFIGIVHMLFVVDQNLFRIEKERNRNENPEIVEYPGALSYVKDSLQVDISKLGYSNLQLTQLGITNRKRVQIDTAVAQLAISKGKKNGRAKHTSAYHAHQLNFACGRGFCKRCWASYCKARKTDIEY